MGGRQTLRYLMLDFRRTFKAVQLGAAVKLMPGNDLLTKHSQ
jgi:hypothetical protein